MTFEITQPPFVIASYRTIDDIVTTNYPIVNLYDNSQGNVIEWQDFSAVLLPTHIHLNRFNEGEWRLIDGERISQFQSIGLNPYIVDDKEISETIS
ncbi:hypothetical protein N9Y26_00535 [bacterium]|nr:hypothetical protein [bacterium]MDB2651790.1 hypothetical protein [bacterium]